MANVKKSEYLVTVNGKKVSAEGGQVSVFDRGFLFGDSVYEVIGSYQGILFTLDAHLERLFQSSELLAIRPTQSFTQIRDWALELFKELGKERVYLRIILTRGEGAPDIKIDTAASTNVFMMIRENPLYPTQWYTQGLKLACPPIHRNPRSSVDPNAKSGNYLNNIMALSLASARGADDAVMLNKESDVTEGTTANIWLVKKGKVKTPSLDTGILRGITRHLILDIGKRFAIPMEEGHYSLQDLHHADEIFLTSSTKEIVPIVEIDGQKVGDGKPGPLTQVLHRHYKELIAEHVAHAKKKGLLFT